ncbi:MAG TPA: O-antigen ligase family protein, partial [Baekduia sp.]|nr:O-antigen ligase family protein [Baekduia sp.]
MGATVALIAVAAVAAIAVVAPAAPLRAGAMLVALLMTPVLLIAHVADSDQLSPLTDHPALAVAAGVVGLLVVAALARLFQRRPETFALAVVATLPFRVPIQSGASTSNLLVPLYAVIAAGVLAYAVPRLRHRATIALEPRPRLLEWVLVGSVVLYAVQASYSIDDDKALENAVFFYVPFTLMFALLARQRWTRRLALQCLGVLIVLSLIFAGIGAVEYATRHLFLNPKVIASNQFESYFRVNSLFFDPNIYGRFLATVMIFLAAMLLWSRTKRAALLAFFVLALLWGGLLLTFSQTSFAALLVGLAVLGGLRWSPRFAAAAATVILVAGIAFAVASPSTLNLDRSSADSATSGRADLVQGGVDLFTSEPVEGLGSGSFSREYRRAEKASSEKAVSASHTVPVTIGAEQGVIGLAAYLALLALAARRLFRGASRDGTRAAVAAAFAALVAHTLGYAAFLEDPITWALLGAGVGLARLPALAPEA